jgi:hypothetical protein
MKKTPWLLVGVLSIALVLGFGNYMHRMGELNGKIAHLTAESKRVDTVYKTLTKTKLLVRVRTDSLLRTDTLFRDTTVRRIILGERAACDAVIETCEQRVALRDSTIKALRKKPSVWSKLPWVAAGVLGGVILSK